MLYLYFPLLLFSLLLSYFLFMNSYGNYSQKLKSLLWSVLGFHTCTPKSWHSLLSPLSLSLPPFTGEGLDCLPNGANTKLTSILSPFGGAQPKNKLHISYPQDFRQVCSNWQFLVMLVIFVPQDFRQVCSGWHALVMLVSINVCLIAAWE